MDLNNWNNLLVIIGVIAIAIEILIGAAAGFELFIVGVICLIGGVVGMYTSTTFALTTMITLSGFYLLFGRAMLKKSLHITTQKTNTEQIMGKEAVVTAKIQKNVPGKIRFEGEVWRAEADMDIDEGTRVSIDSVSGVTLKVHKINS